MSQAHRPEIERALRFIATHLDRPISVEEVARAAHLSEFHLHRVFHAAVGESIGRFITRRRLELAALCLAYQPDRSVTDIALSSGYSSSSNFSKAFAGYFGVSPTRVRQPDQALPSSVGKLTALYGRTFRPQDLYTLPAEQEASERAREAAFWSERVRFETIAERTFVCLAGPGGYDPSLVEATWHELIQRARQLGVADGDIDAWGVAHDSPHVTAPELCRYHAAIPCEPNLKVPRPLFLGKMEAGRYAVFHFEGSVAQVAGSYRSIYSCWFPESSLAPADFTPIDHYVGDFPENGHVTLEMWFRVRARV